MITWPDFKFPGVNLLNYPRQNRDYKMNINEETTVRPVWKPKATNNASSMQVDGTHYKTMGVEPWELMESVLTQEQFIGFLKGNAIKYALRDGKKDGAVYDAEKARHYMAKLAEFKTKTEFEW